MVGFRAFFKGQGRSTWNMKLKAKICCSGVQIPFSDAVPRASGQAFCYTPSVLNKSPHGLDVSPLL